MFLLLRRWAGLDPGRLRGGAGLRVLAVSRHRTRPQPAQHRLPGRPPADGHGPRRTAGASAALPLLGRGRPRGPGRGAVLREHRGAGHLGAVRGGGRGPGRGLHPAGPAHRPRAPGRPRPPGTGDRPRDRGGRAGLPAVVPPAGTGPPDRPHLVQRNPGPVRQLPHQLRGPGDPRDGGYDHDTLRRLPGPGAPRARLSRPRGGDRGRGRGGGVAPRPPAPVVRGPRDRGRRPVARARPRHLGAVAGTGPCPLDRRRGGDPPHLGGLPVRRGHGRVGHRPHPDLVPRPAARTSPPAGRRRRRGPGGLGPRAHRHRPGPQPPPHRPAGGAAPVVRRGRGPPAAREGGARLPGAVLRAPVVGGLPGRHPHVLGPGRGRGPEGGARTGRRRPPGIRRPGRCLPPARTGPRARPVHPDRGATGAGRLGGDHHRGPRPARPPGLLPGQEPPLRRRVLHRGDGPGPALCGLGLGVVGCRPVPTPRPVSPAAFGACTAGAGSPAGSPLAVPDCILGSG